MKAFVTLPILLFLASCTEAPVKTTPSDPWAAGRFETPRRAVIFVVEGLTPATQDPASFPHLQTLTQKGLQFENAIYGHLNPAVALSRRLLFEGKYPRDDKAEKALPTQFSFLDPNQRFHEVNALSSTSVWSEGHCGKDEEWTVSTLWFSAVGEVPSLPLVEKTLTEVVTTCEEEKRLSSTIIAVVGVPLDVPTRPVPFNFSSPEVLRLKQEKYLSVWVKQREPVTLAKISSRLRKTDQFSEIFTKQQVSGGLYYLRTFRDPSLLENLWAEENHLRIVEASASTTSPDLVALWLKRFPLKSWQRVSWFIWSPTLQRVGSQTPETVRMVDFAPTLARLFRKAGVARFDGSSAAIDPYLTTPPP